MTNKEQGECVSGAPRRRLQMLAGESSAKCRSFVFSNEGHTLGNVLRQLLLLNPDVVFAGYSVPHPAEDEMVLRIQTRDGSAQEALRKALEDVVAMCDITENNFVTEMNNFKELKKTIEQRL